MASFVVIVSLLLVLNTTDGVYRQEVDSGCNPEFPVWTKPIAESDSTPPRCCTKEEIYPILYPDFQSFEFHEQLVSEWIKVCGITKAMVWCIDRWVEYPVDTFLVSHQHFRVPIEPGQLLYVDCLLYTSPSPRDLSTSRMPSSA